MRTLALVMAGGQGTRLHPLTRDRAKPAVPFGGKYRIIDFVLSNLVNSRHLLDLCPGPMALAVADRASQGRMAVRRDAADHFITPVPAQMRIGESWYQGTADAIYQNLNLIEDNKPDLVAVFGADHIYRMDIPQMIEFHHERKAAVTVATLPVPMEEADQFGIVDVDSGLRVNRLRGEAEESALDAGRARAMCLASMGNYLFDPEVLTRSADRGCDPAQQSRLRQDLIPA